MFAVLGEIVFAVLSSPNTIESARRWDYVEHRVVENRPRLQWLGDGLETLAVEMMFHISFADPVAQLAALNAAASDHAARALVFGNGDHRGYFVVTAVNTTSTQTSATGDPIAIALRVELKEWAMSVESDPSVPPRPLFTPIAAVSAPAGTPTGPIDYSAGKGMNSVLARLLTTYVPPLLAAPGVSSILNNPTHSGTPTPKTLASDIPVKTIVRAA
jgi:phage protein U